MLTGQDRIHSIRDFLPLILRSQFDVVLERRFGNSCSESFAKRWESVHITEKYSFRSKVELLSQSGSLV